MSFPHMSESLPKLADPEEVAKALGRDVTTIRRQLRKGVLPGIKLEGRWYVNVDVLAERLGGRVA